MRRLFALSGAFSGALTVLALAALVTPASPASAATDVCSRAVVSDSADVLDDARVEQAAATAQHPAETGRAWPARLTAAGVVQHARRMRIGQQRLHACERAQRTAHLLTQETGVSPGGGGVEQHPERFPAAAASAWRGGQQSADRAEQADEGDAGPH